MLANEHLPRHDVPERAVADVTITNNLVTGMSSGIQYWHDEERTRANTYRRIRVLHNVFKDIAAAPIRIDPVPSARRRPVANVAANNVIYSGYDGRTLMVGNRSAWRITHNAFPDGTPSDSGSGNVAADPAFADAGAGAPAGFRLEKGSPLIGAGTPVRGVPRDMWGARRTAPPSIGLHEPAR